MNPILRRVLCGTLLMVCLGLLVTPTTATSSLTITLDPSTIAPTETTVVTVTSTLPAGATLHVILPAPLTTTIQPSGCTATTDGWQCRLTESPQIVTLGVAAPADTPDGMVVTLTAQAGPATAATTLTVAGGPVATWTPTATATPTPAMTATPWVVTATPTSTPVPTTTTGPQPDVFEPNNTIIHAAPIGLGRVDKLSFWPAPDVDYFALQVKDSQAGLRLTIDTTISPGLDTRLRLLRPDGSVIADNDDVSPTDVRSRIETTAEAGLLILEVTNMSATRPDYKVYSLDVQLVAATAITATPVPKATDDPVWDAYAGNYAWDTAADIPLGEPLKGLSFGCPDYDYLSPTLGTCTVPDFFRVTVKGGTCYAAVTTVTPGVDTNVIVYGAGRDTEPPWTGNDDAAPDDLGSRVRFCVPPEQGITDAYLLIGPVGRIPAPLSDRRYTLVVTAALPVTLTLTPLPVQTAPVRSEPMLPPGDASPAPSQELPNQPEGGTASEPVVIPPPAQGDMTDGFTLVQNVTIESVTNAPPEPTAVPLVITPLTVLACYDRNANRLCDVDEGIAGMAVVVSDARRGVVLGTSLTDGHGAATITVRVPETTELLVAVPSFGYAQRATARQSQVPPLIIKKTVPLPALIP